jgi:hypothetical protein
MSELYKEAIAEAKKLREVAELDARNKIIEAVTPYIKKIIASEATSTSSFLFGEEDTPSDDPMSGMEPVSPGEMPPGSAPVPPVEEPAVTPGDSPNAAPISPAGGLVGMPMPDDEGKITVDFQQLFTMGGGDALASPPEGDLGNATAASGMVTPPGGEVAPGGPMGGPQMPGASQVAPAAPIQPGVAPAPAAATPPEAGAAAVPPEEELPTPVVAGESKIIKFQDDVRVVAEKIDYLYFRGSVPLLVKESLKSRLFTLCENLDELVNEDIISSKKARLAENKLEFLFMKLNEAEQQNSYKEIKGVQMTTLREFAAKLFEEDALGPATADKATAHAEKVSGVQPGVDLFKEGEAPKTDQVKGAAASTEEKNEGEGDLKEMTEALLGEDAPASSAFGDGKMEGNAENKSPKVHNPDALAKEKGAGIVESAPASSAFGDGEKAKGAENASPDVHKGAALADEKGANTILEFDEKELREAVSKLRKENLARKLAAVKKEAALKGTDKDGHLKPPSVPEGDQGSAKPEGGKDPSQEKLEECGLPEMDMAGGAPSVESMEAGHGGGGEDQVELTFQIDVDDLEALLSGATEDFVAEPEGEVSGGGDIELVDDDEGEEMLLDTEEEGEPSGEEEEEEVALESKRPAVTKENKTGSKKPVLAESVVVAKAAAAVKSLKAQLAESKLLTAKSLYVSKFAVREDLTTKQKQKIAEYFDKAKNLAEAKDTYNKIKKILAESASSTKLSGSASKPTSTGSAKLTESAQTGANSGGVDQIDQARWMLLAGIKSKK